MQALLKVLHSPDVNTVYPAEHKFPQHCLLLYPLHPTSPQRLSSQHLLTNGGRGGTTQLNSSKILLTQKPSMFTPFPQLCSLKILCFLMSFLSSLIGDHGMDGPLLLRTCLLLWWTEINGAESFSWKNFLAEFWWEFSALPKAFTLNLTPGCADWPQNMQSYLWIRITFYLKTQITFLFRWSFLSDLLWKRYWSSRNNHVMQVVILVALGSMSGAVYENR